MLEWTSVGEIIKADNLHLLTRSKEQELHYDECKKSFVKTHGSNTNYIIQERLKWPGDLLKPSNSPFLQNKADFKILKNDFSYDFEPDVRHLVVWTKVPIPSDDRGHPNQEAITAIEEYVTNKFINEFKIPESRVLWFKNPTALQTVPAVAHFHVLIKECTDELVTEIEKSTE